MIEEMNTPEFWLDRWRETAAPGTPGLMSGYRSRAVWDHMAEHYEQWSADDDHAECGRIIGMIEEAGLSPDGCRVLEVGCGTGRIAIPLAAAGAAVTAMDFSPRMLDITRRSVPAEVAGRLETVEADWNAIDLDDRGWRQAFDLVIAAMTPAVISPESFLTLCDASRGFCYFRGWARREPDPLLAGMWNHLLDTPLPRPRPNAVVALNLLFARRRNPRAAFEDVCWERAQPRAEAAAFCRGYFSDLCPEFPAAVLDERVGAYLDAAADDGDIPRRVSGTTCALFWKEGGR